MKLDESLLLLVMRLYFEEALKRFEVNEAGEVEVESETILEVYEERTGRERPLIGRVREILIGFRQRGLVRLDEHEDRRSFTLFLRPALPMVVAEDALASLESFVAGSGKKDENAGGETADGPGVSP
jgi:flagellar motor component MotA